MTPDMPKRIFTDAQTRAFLALPIDGSRLIKPDRTLSRALDSLRLRHRALCASELGNFGPRGARVNSYRLTDAGIALRKEIGQ